MPTGLTSSKDVYHSGDGGLYAELIQNRAFQGTTVNVDGSGHIDPPFQTLEYWHSTGLVALTLDNATPSLSEALPWHMRVDIAANATGDAGFWNEGYWGMNVNSSTTYTASFYLRGSFSGQMRGTFKSGTSNLELGSTVFNVSQNACSGWVKYEESFKPFSSGSDGNNTFSITFDAANLGGQILRFNMISVFPQTYQNSNSVLRDDLAQAIQDINGKFLRFPGGNNLEGQSSPYRWKWNETIGSLIDRPGRPGTWGYYNTDGFGLLEMMQVTLPI